MTYIPHFGVIPRFSLVSTAFEYDLMFGAHGIKGNYCASEPNKLVLTVGLD
jgi:hypothetical protein